MEVNEVHHLLPTFFKVSSFVFSGRKKFIQVWCPSGFLSC